LKSLKVHTEKRAAHSRPFGTVDKVGFCHPERSAAKSKDLKSPCFQDFRSFDSGFASAQDDNLIGLSTHGNGRRTAARFYEQTEERAGPEGACGKGGAPQSASRSPISIPNSECSLPLPGRCAFAKSDAALLQK
jgi:hypothetical protein